jgi:ribosomal protein S18 acetylase RimI-like enzyme
VSAMRDDADVDGDTTCVSGVTVWEAALEIRKAITPNEISGAVAIVEALTGSTVRADYIVSVAENGGLSIAVSQSEIQAFCCLDHRYFFEKPFISLLIVAPHARRFGLGAGLLSHNSRKLPEVWTSTNRSNLAMLGLLRKLGWRYCGELIGLDEGDPEQFFVIT